MRRFIYVFDLTTEELVKEIPLADTVSLIELQELFGLSSGDQLQNVLVINASRAAFIEERLGIEFDFDRFEYTLECFR